MKLTALHIDGTLYVAIAVAGFLQATCGSDEAINMVPSIVLFYTKVMVGAIGAGALALKMFRSTAFADAKTNGNGNSTVTTVTVAPGTPTVDVSTKKEEPVIK